MFVGNPDIPEKKLFGFGISVARHRYVFFADALSSKLECLSLLGCTCLRVVKGSCFISEMPLLLKNVDTALKKGAYLSTFSPLTLILAHTSLDDSHICRQLELANFKKNVF